MSIEKVRQFGQVKIHHKESVAEEVFHRGEAAVADPPLVDTAVHGSELLAEVLGYVKA